MTALFLEWLYIDAPQRILITSKQLTLALFHYFSISVLFQTLVDPWRHDARPLTGLPIKMWGEIIVNNIVSRVIGFFLRSTVIALGVITVFMVLLGTVCLLVFWYGLPLFLIASIMYGISLLGGSYA